MQKIVKIIIFLIFLFILSVFFIGLNRDTNYNTANQINKEIPDFKVSYLDKENFFTKNDKRYVNIFENQDSSLMKNLSLANCLVKVPAKKIALKSDFLEIYELNNGL